MEKSNRVLSTVPIEYFDDSSTQDATDFDEHFDSDSNQSNDNSQHTIDEGNVQTLEIIWNREKNSTSNVTNHLSNFNQTTILSPISELAMNVALTKLTSASNVTASDQDASNQTELKIVREHERIPQSIDEPRTPSAYAFASLIKKSDEIKKDNGQSSTESCLITNALTINSNAISPSSRRIQRRLNVAPLNFDDTSNSPIKMPSEEMSLYSGNTPQGSPRPCSISSCLEMGMLSPLRENERIEERHDIDFNSMDSGYSNNSRKLFTFVQPSALPPKPSPPKTVRISPTSISCFRSFNSLSSDSMDSMDEDCMDLVDMEAMVDDNAQLPTSFNSIISGNIKSNSSISNSRTPVIRRCLSMTDGNVNRGSKTPELLKSIPETDSPFQSKFDSIIKTFKRPEPPTVGSPVQSKRYKQSMEDKENTNEMTVARPVFRKSISMNDDIIMNALSRSSSEPHLIGDFSRPFCLPLMEGRHSDLKSISAHTMAKLLRGEYNESVASFKVVDCRYPYEFEGGHIRGAQNLYTQEQILTELVNSKTDTPKLVSDEPKRNIIVFHCEFSSERGPKLSRFLRNNDRSRNEHAYPALHYPEIYLLHGGYKDFFEVYPELCDPISYRQMLDPMFSSAYRHFRAKSKSWNGDQKNAGRTTNRLVKTKSRNLIY